MRPGHWYGRSAGLTLRMAIVMGLLALVYLAFITVLFALRVNIVFIGIFVVGTALVQYFFSDLFDLGIEVLGHPKPDAHTIVRGKMEDRSFAVLYLDGSRDIVTGALTVNRPSEELDQYRVLIRQQASLHGFLREAEQHPDEDLTGLVPDLDAANAMLEAGQQQA